LTMNGGPTGNISNGGNDQIGPGPGPILPVKTINGENMSGCNDPGV
jgi:hypothetical protein